MDLRVLTEALASLSWREALIAIVAVLVLYVLVAFLRMRRLKRTKATVSVAEPLVAQAALAAYAAAREPALSAQTPAEASESIDSAQSTEPAAPEFPWNEPPPPIPGQQLIDALARDVYQLRSEVGTLRAELLQVREEMRQELTQTLTQTLAQTQTTHSVSPLYSDAMQMAIQGHDATTISQHCGIARAEAELVVALVRNRDNGN